MLLLCSLLQAVGLAAASDFDTVAARRKSDIAVVTITASYSRNDNYTGIPIWINTLRPDGTWPDVNYTAGCGGDRTTWLAEQHLARTLGLSQAFSGLNPAIDLSYAGSASVWNTASSALSFWFNNDYNNTACLVNGGTGKCPCSTPGLWNPNWYFQGIGVPTLVSESCLLLSSGNLTSFQRSKCLEIGLRGSNFSPTQVLAPNYQTASNLALILQACISTAIYSNNATLLEQAFSQAMAAYSYADTAGADGIHRDGSFLQHTGQLYNGNYGRDFLNSFVQLQGEAVGTAYAANDTQQAAIATLLRGDDWQIFTDKQKSKLYWDFSVIGRWISHPRSDGYATSGLGLNVSALTAATEVFTGSSNVGDVLLRLQQSSSAVTLSGNKAYQAGDYMVHRRPGYVLFNKMISSRGQNQEFVNNDNTMGYHMSQGHLFTWIDGTEYQDITGAWDWYIIPGTTVLYHYPTLNTSWVGVTGKNDFVGVVSDGTNGVSVMDYVDPHDGSISYRRSWFYIGDLVVNTIVNATAHAGSAPIVTVLDQRLSNNGAILINGNTASPGNMTTAQSLGYGSNGYFTYGVPFNLTTFNGPMTGNWAKLGTSSQISNTQNIFSAYHTIPQGGSFSYGHLPASSAADLAAQLASPSVTPLNSTAVSGVHGNGYIALAFWPNSTPTTTVQGDWSASAVSITVSDPAILIASKTGSQVTLSVADPTQKLQSLTVTLSGPTFSCSNSTAGGCSTSNGAVSLIFNLPTGGYAGGAVVQTLNVSN